MDLIDKIYDLSKRIPRQIEHTKTEEATKNAFIMPLINILGYDVFNPTEVVPEFTADVGTKKGEKVDYAIKKEDKIIILMECKAAGCNLEEEHASQLYRYFSVTESRFGILTNGIVYKFYSDIDEPNKMDSKPFFEFNMLNFEEHQVDELKKFTKSAFELDSILSSASTLKYTGAIKRIFASELSSPTDEFVKFFAAQVYSGKITQSVKSQFSTIVKNALNQFIRERINDRLKSALENEAEETQKSSSNKIDDETNDNGIITTQEEIDAYNVIKAIARDVTDVNRITMRDAKSYCGIILDDNNRKPICRLHFNYSTKKCLGIFSQKKETKYLISSADDIYNYSDFIKSAIIEYIQAENQN